MAYSASRGSLKRKRSQVFKPNKLPSSSKGEFVICKRSIIRTLHWCKDSGAKVCKLLNRGCGCAEPDEVLKQLIGEGSCETNICCLYKGDWAM